MAPHNIKIAVIITHVAILYSCTNLYSCSRKSKTLQLALPPVVPDTGFLIYLNQLAEQCRVTICTPYTLHKVKRAGVISRGNYTCIKEVHTYKSRKDYTYKPYRHLENLKKKIAVSNPQKGWY